MLLIKKYFQHLKILLFFLLMVSSPPCFADFAPQLPHAENAPFLNNGGLGNKGNPFADDAAAQAEFNKILDELEQMPEDKLQELEQQLQAEVKRELEAMTPERRKEFDKEMADFWRSQGVDPNQLPSLDELLGVPTGAEPAPGTAAAPTPETVTSKKIDIIPAEHTPQEAEELLGQLLTHLESLRHKMAVYPNLVRKLQAWKEAIDDLVYYLKIMDVAEHHERLVTKEFANLFKHLKTLQKELASAEPRFISAPPKSDSSEDPYDILRIDPTATDQEIKDAYESYSKENDPAALRARLTAEGFEESEIEGRIKSAQLNLRTVKEAYEKISNPKIRAQTDRALAAKQEHSQVGLEQSQGALNALVNALSQAIYQKNVLEDINRFMSKYEPTKLEQRKKMEEAEQQRRKEQEVASKLRPLPAAYSSYEPIYLPGGPSYQAPSAGGPSYPSYGEKGYGQAPGYRDGGVSGPSKPGTSGGGGGSGKASTSDKDKDKDKERKDSSTTSTTAKTSDKKKSLADEWTEAVHAVNKELDLLHSDIVVRDSQNPEKLLPKIGGLVTAASTAQDIAKEQPAETDLVASEKKASEAAAPEAPGAIEVAEDAKVAELPQESAPLPAPEVNKQHLQDVIAFVENSPRTEPLQKALKKLASLTEKVEEEKVNIPKKETLLQTMQQKPAFTMLKSVGQLQTRPRMPTRSDIVETSPKAKKLFEHVNKLTSNLASVS